MKQRMATYAAAITALACAGSLRAHHSSSMFDLSMPIWVKRGLGQADLTHPTGAGAERISDWVFDAMMKGYAAHRAGPSP